MGAADVAAGAPRDAGRQQPQPQQQWQRQAKPGRPRVASTASTASAASSTAAALKKAAAAAFHERPAARRSAQSWQEGKTHANGGNTDLDNVLRDLQQVVALQQRALPELERSIVRACEHLYNIHLAMGFFVLLSETLLYDGEATITSRLAVMIVCMVALFQTLSLQQGHQRMERLRQDSLDEGTASKPSDGAHFGPIEHASDDDDARGRASPRWRTAALRQQLAVPDASPSTAGGLPSRSRLVKVLGQRAASTPEPSGGLVSQPLYAMAEPAAVPAKCTETEAGAATGPGIDLAHGKVKVVSGPDERDRSCSSILSTPSVNGSAPGSGRRHHSMTSNTNDGTGTSICVVDGIVVKTEAEARAVKELRRRLQDLEPVLDSLALNLSDKTLVRFLRARKMNVKVAEALFRDAHAWREEKEPAQVFARMEHEPWPELFQYATGGWAGVDKEGSPLFIDRVGQVDVAGLLARAKPEHFEKLCIWRLETNQRLMLESERRTGRPQYQMCVIQDLKGLGMQHFNRNAFKFLQVSAQINDTYYPEQLKVCYVVNAPKIFSTIWGVVQRFFDPQTRAKIQIFPGCPTELLKEKIDASMLPAFLGGDLTSHGDPHCKDIILPGGKVPEHIPSLTHEHFA